MLTTFPSPEELKGTVQGTLLYMFLYFGVFIPFQAFSKFYLHKQKKEEARRKGGNEKVSFRATKYYNSRDLLALAGDRTVGNFVEYAILFIPLLWMHALFVDPSQSWTICVLYTLFRGVYPILYMQSVFLLFSTGPCYLILLYMVLQIFFKVALA